MRTINNPYKVISLTLLFFLTISCGQEDKVFDTPLTQSISFEAKVGSSTTRGTLVKRNDKIKNMGVYAYNTGSGKYDDYSYVIPNLLSNLKVEYKNNHYTPEHRVEWPRKADANVSFFAYSPYVSEDNGLSIKSGKNGLPTIHYEVPADCEKQPDLMVSRLKKDLNVIKDGDKPVNFEMRHALTAVSFKARGVGQVSYIAISSNIFNSADLVINKSGDFKWENLKAKVSDYYYDKVIPGVELNGQYQRINTEDGYLMMIPQEIPQGTLIWAYFENSKKWVKYNIGGKTWKAGEHVCYNLDVNDIIEEYTIRNPYVGAFWRKGQTGERIIRMEVESDTKTYNTGSWKVEVLDRGDFNDGDIVFSKEKSRDANVYTNKPNDAENYRVYGTPTLEQKMSELKEFNGKKYIYFRIGLKSTTTQNRYASVKVSYGHLDDSAKTKEVLLYLRQGDAADYVINHSNLSKKISPYNLTDPRIANYTAIQTVHEGAIFTDYPSQPGVFYRWAGAEVAYIKLDGKWEVIPKREAFSPVSTRITEMGQEISQSFWGYIYSSYKVSPRRYRRPRVGSYNGYYGNIYSSITYDRKYTPNVESYDLKLNQIYYSELTQSLFYNMYKPEECSQFGYYADGYFDRLKIENNNAVRPTLNSVAYAGRLFYNPETNASIFFPACGYRDGKTGQVKGAGEVCRIWTSAAYNVWNMYRALCLEIGKDRVGYSLPFRSEAVNIRCVKGKDEDHSHHDDDDDDDDDD